VARSRALLRLNLYTTLLGVFSINTNVALFNYTYKRSRIVSY